MTTTTAHVPLILIRGFGGLDVEDERRVAYQGFNDGTVYPQKRGENYIYEGLVLKYLKSDWRYHDATNVVGYYTRPVEDRQDLPEPLQALPPEYFSGHRLVIDPGTALHLVQSREDPRRSVWIFRYYDFGDRSFRTYGEALVRLIDFIRDLTVVKTGDPKPTVNIIAHSMGGLIVREALQVTYPSMHRRGEDSINKIVTLGTPHRGISFQGIRDLRVVEAEDELERFNPKAQADESNPWSYHNLAKHFPPSRILTVVGTNYRSYGTRTATVLNRLFSAPQEHGWNYNRSDGLVKQSSAQLPGAPRTFIHKCHGGQDSLVTSREAFEVATRFFHGDLYARLHLLEARVKRGLDRFGRSEIFFGVSIKPRRVDFDLFHQSADAENCYGPFRSPALTDDLRKTQGFEWAGPDRLIWEGWFDSSRISPVAADGAQPGGRRDVVLRLDFYVSERDLFGIGFSDNAIFRKQYYIRAVAPRERSIDASLDGVSLFLHRDEDFDDASGADALSRVDGMWSFRIEGTGFEARLGIQLQKVT